MVTESFASLLCAGLIAMMFGLLLTFAGYRFFLFLLPIWGFFFGFGLAAQTIQALGQGQSGLLQDISSWIVGFVVGALFAVLAYFFYIVAVAIIAGSLGYVLAVGLLGAIGMDFGLIVWLCGIVAAVAVAGATLFLNLQKWVIMIGTAVMGAGTIIGTFVLLFNPSMSVLEAPVKAALATSPLLMLLGLALVIAGVVVQQRQSKYFNIDNYNRWDDSTVVS
jgi:hypothetical protein